METCAREHWNEWAILQIGRESQEGTRDDIDDAGSALAVPNPPWPFSACSPA